MNAIFIVFQGVKIAACCKRNQISRVQRELPVGEWRVVENFQVGGASGKFRPTKHQFKLTLTGDTEFGKSDFHSDNSFVSLARYEDIHSGKLDDHFFNW